MISSHFIGCPPGRAEQQSIPLLIIRKSYDKIKKVLYDFWDAGSAAQLIISRMISSFVGGESRTLNPKFRKNAFAMGKNLWITSA